jgi:hypothetical protein
MVILRLFHDNNNYRGKSIVQPGRKIPDGILDRANALSRTLLAARIHPRSLLCRTRLANSGKDTLAGELGFFESRF